MIAKRNDVFLYLYHIQQESTIISVVLKNKPLNLWHTGALTLLQGTFFFKKKELV